VEGTVKRTLTDILIGVGLMALVVLLAVALAGCSQPPLSRSETPNATESVSGIKAEVRKGINAGEKGDKAIDAAAVKAPEAKPELDVAKAANKEQRDAFFKIDDFRAKLGELQGKIDALATERDKAIQRAERAESEANRWQSKLLMGIQIAAGLAVAVSFALMIWGTLRTALPTFIAAAVFAGSMFIQMAIEYRLQIGLGVGAVTVGLLAYELFIKKRAIGEIAATVDDTLRDANDKLPVHLVAVAKHAQSEVTKKLIDTAQGNGPLNKARRWLGGFIAGQPVAVKV
jgi:outer membrane murein-binding lipoprotein Lpp